MKDIRENAIYQIYNSGAQFKPYVQKHIEEEDLRAYDCQQKGKKYISHQTTKVDPQIQRQQEGRGSTLSSNPQRSLTLMYLEF